jgi:histone-binding protein RBBP4
MWDRRNLGSGGAGSPIHKFEGHKAAVLCVQACQDNIFAVIFSLCGCGCFLCCFFIPLFFAIILSFRFQWSPDRASVFGSSAEDGFLNVWDHEKVTTHTLNYLVFSEGTMHNIGEGDWVQLLVISHLFLWPD